MNDSLNLLIFVVHLASTLFMASVTWFVQFVQYPLLRYVGELEFPDYEERRRSFTRWVVLPPMLVEAVSAVLLFKFPPTGIPAWSLIIGLALLGCVWLSTILIQWHCQNLLRSGYDNVVHRQLLSSSCVRTAAWSLRAVLLLWVTWSLLSVASPQPPGSPVPARIEVGQRAPDFTATTQDGQKISLSDFLGKRGLVLFFYPKDGTSVCTKEACAFRDSYQKIVDAGVEVIGVSGDSEKNHREFIRQNNLPFSLISDSDGSLRRSFGVASVLGIVPGRVTFVIDKDGIIRQIYSALFASDEHVKQALNAVSNLKTEPE